jgi:hypothetical protein
MTYVSELKAHIEQLLKKHAIAFEFIGPDETWSYSFANPECNKVYIPVIRSSISYAVALHARRPDFSPVSRLHSSLFRQRVAGPTARPPAGDVRRSQWRTNSGSRRRSGLNPPVRRGEEDVVRIRL